jgi:putative ATP-binding cassette transporter
MDNKKERLSKTDKLLKEKAEDSKKLRVEFEPSQKEAVKIKDFVIQINEKDSLTLKEFSLEKGKCYAISGPTGKGKSTFLGKLKGINKDSMLCSGEIIYSAESINEVFSVPQSDYFPLKKSLIEAICYPNTCSEYSRNKISLLLRKSGLANLINRLDEVGDFTNTLSGGQKKIMKIISAILASPRILLLDETLTGLDNEIAIVIQKLIKDYLPNTTVLVVDHSIDENNRKINGKDFMMTYWNLPMGLSNNIL